MKHNDDGAEAEERVAEYLTRKGFEIITKNWKTKSCEIDIIAQKKGTVHFVEVKYRSSNSQGSGVEYITNKKLQKMIYAAELWVLQNNWAGGYVLSAAEVNGPDFEIQFIENIT